MYEIIFSYAWKVFLVALVLNIGWEFGHSWLYLTCRRMKRLELNRLLIKMSLRDAFWITFFYIIICAWIGTPRLFHGYEGLSIFLAISLIFAYFVERHAIARRRWEYAPEMPRFLGVGATPLLELSATGILVFLAVL